MLIRNLQTVDNVLFISDQAHGTLYWIMQTEKQINDIIFAMQLFIGQNEIKCSETYIVL